MNLPAADQLHTTAQAAEALGVGESLISKWRYRGLVAPAGVVPGRGRGGLQPLYWLADLRPLVERYQKRKAAEV